MKMTVLQEHLFKALGKTGRIISSHTQLPILNTILIKAINEGAQITATNTEATIIVYVAAKTEETGGLCIPSKVFTELIMSLPPKPVLLTTEKQSLGVECAGYHATIPGVAQEEFPPVPQKPKSGATTLNKKEMIHAISSVLFSAATDEGRPTLTGVRISKSGKDTIFVAADGYRLSLNRAEGIYEKEINAIIPAKALSEVVRIGTEEKEEEKIGFLRFENSQVGFLLGDTEIYTRRIDGEYPSVEKILPKSHSTRVTVEKEVLVRAVKSAAIFARDNANIIKLHIGEKGMLVSANTPQIGENKIECEATVEGEGGEIAFNGRFLLDFLNVFWEERVVFEMTGSLNPGVFKPVKGSSYLHIIMPVRVQT